MKFSEFIAILIILPFFCFSQTKEIDAYFILNKNDKEYKLVISEYESKITAFSLYNRKQYQERDNVIVKDKKEGNYNEMKVYKRPESYLYHIKKTKEIIVNNSTFKQLNIVNYKWLIQNSWKENNPNILFKDLYFLLEINKNEFQKFKVYRTLIAY